MLITAEQAPSIVADPDVTRCDLPVQGMTCASCVLRVERALKATPGVQEAHVNLVTRRASVVFDRAATGPEALARAIEAVGYEVPRAAAVTAQRPGRRAEAQAQAEVDEQRALRRDFVVAAALGGPLLIVAMSLITAAIQWLVGERRLGRRGTGRTLRSMKRILAKMAEA